MRVVVTGGQGFIGRNLMLALGRRDDVEAMAFDVADPPESLWRAAAEADVVFHLAGVNRPKDVSEFGSGNVALTAELCSRLKEAGAAPVIVFASSIQAERDNAYGVSKRQAEEVLERWSREGGGNAAIYRLPNVFGKWARPEYNSVVATFCHNIARGLPIRVDDPASSVTLVHVGDVVAAFLDVPGAPPHGVERRVVESASQLTVGELAALIRSFHEGRHAPDVPDLSDHFVRTLYSTYLSYLGDDELAFLLGVRADERGELSELLREPHAGQVFVSHTHPGVIRGDHYHDTKVERFMVVEGEGLIRMRRVGGDEVREYRVSGTEPTAVIIPPGTAHSIENVGQSEMVTLFWAGEVFDPTRPDTYHEKVVRGEGAG